MRGRGFRLVAGIDWADRVLLESIAVTFRRREAMNGRAAAYRRWCRVRGRGTAHGRTLAIAVFNRWKQLSPMFNHGGNA